MQIEAYAVVVAAVDIETKNELSIAFIHSLKQLMLLAEDFKRLCYKKLKIPQTD